MIVDKKGKLFGKVSIIDAVIIAVVILAIAGLGYKFANLRSTGKDDIVITFYADDVPEFVTKQVVADSTVKDPVKNVILGKLTEIKTDKSIVYTQDDEGVVKVSTRPNHVSLYVTAEGKGVIGKHGATIGNSEYAIGKYIEIRVGMTAFWVRVYSISEKE